MRKIALAGLAATFAMASSPSIAQPANLAASDLAWKTMLPGVEFAPAYGDWEKQAHGKYVRIATGTTVSMHTHTAPYSAVMITGEMTNLHDGETRVTVKPGDYWHIAGGQPHGHVCTAADGCLFYTHSDAAWDVQLIEAD